MLVIFAPTASGKTALLFNLFGQGSPYFFKGRAEVISADSMQVYRGQDIGTAKPSSAELAQLPHHLIDIMEPSEQFSVADFVSMADSCCAGIYSRGKLPVIAGGTGFYIRSFLLGLPSTPESVPEIRDALKLELEERGIRAMYEELSSIDRISAAKINPNDAYRILRALEVYRISGKPRSYFELSIKLREGYDFFPVILERGRDDLYRRIDMRVDQMFDAGLEKEVASLMNEKGCRSDFPGMQAIGYREFFSFHPESGKTVRDMIKHDSRKYAKKQYVFMEGIPGAVKYSVPEGDEMPEGLISDIFSFCSRVLS